MSLDKLKTMKLILLTGGESRRGWTRLGNDTVLYENGVPESKNNRCYASFHRHGGVCGVGMLRSVIETSGEILIIGITAKPLYPAGVEALKSDVTSYQNSERIRDDEEVGGVHNSVDDFVMKFGAKEPYLVDANREGKDV